MPTINLLYEHSYPITEKISVVIPTVGDILSHHDEYYSLLSIFTSMPIDMMVQLDDVGIDYTKINEFDLFLLMFESLKSMDTSLVLGDLDLGKFKPAISEDTNRFVLIDTENDIKIDKIIHSRIAATLRHIHNLEKNRRKPANEEAKKYLLKRAREKMRRNKKRSTESELENLIVSMVNTEQFKYDYESTRNLTIFQFNSSVKQIIKKIDYDGRIYGIYAGTIDPKELSQDKLTWLASNNN